MGSKADPRNVLLSRQSRLRLSAELIRDVTIEAGGLLSTRIGGPAVRPPQPESVVKEGFDNPWVVSEGEDRFRRGLYTFIQRTSPFAQSVTFDGADPNRSCARRERSDTPLQALTLLNDPVFFQAAQGLARRILSSPAQSVSERIDLAFMICLSRHADSIEHDRLTKYLQAQQQIFRADPQSAAEVAADIAPHADRAKVAAWVGLSSILLNLDEFITRG